MQTGACVARGGRSWARCGRSRPVGVKKGVKNVIQTNHHSIHPSAPPSLLPTLTTASMNRAPSANESSSSSSTGAPRRGNNSSSTDASTGGAPPPPPPDVVTGLVGPLGGGRLPPLRLARVGVGRLPRGVAAAGGGRRGVDAAVEPRMLGGVVWCVAGAGFGGRMRRQMAARKTRTRFLFCVWRLSAVSCSPRVSNPLRNTKSQQQKSHSLLSLFSQPPPRRRGRQHFEPLLRRRPVRERCARVAVGVPRRPRPPHRAGQGGGRLVGQVSRPQGGQQGGWAGARGGGKGRRERSARGRTRGVQGSSRRRGLPLAGAVVGQAGRDARVGGVEWGWWRGGREGGRFNALRRRRRPRPPVFGSPPCPRRRCRSGRSLSFRGILLVPPARDVGPPIVGGWGDNGRCSSAACARRRGGALAAGPLGRRRWWVRGSSLLII